MDLSLKDKWALVCGSTQGIGKEIALQLAEMGASVTLVARNEDSLKKTCGQMRQEFGQEHYYVVADFQKPEELKARIDDYMGKEEREIHILVNNTGGPPGGPIAQATVEAFQEAFSLHLICNHILVQACLEGMKKSGYGRIINIVSTSVKQPLKGLGVSNTVRGAVASWAKTLASELGPYAITVNNVLPGATQTGRLDSIIENKAKKSNSSIDETVQAMQAQIPLGRFARPEEVAYAAAFLASPSAAYINGISLAVDGGRTLGL